MAELSLVAKVTVVLALTLAAAWALRGARASLRALLLSSAFGVLLALPAAPLLVPERVVEIPVTYDGAFPLLVEDIGEAVPAGARAARGAALDGAAWRIPSASSIVRGLWIAVALALALRLGIALWRLRGIRRTAVPWITGERRGRLLAEEAGVTRCIEILLHEALSAPMTFGVIRPAIGLPEDATRWPEAELRHALLHEIEHVRRGDWPLHLLARVVCALYWFHPLVWVAARRLCLEAERACDDGVLRRAEQAQYAEQLVTLARRLSKRDPVAVLSMADRSDLSTRVRAVLDPRQRRGRAGMWWTLGVVSVSIALTLTISPLQAVSRIGAKPPVNDDAPQAPAAIRQPPPAAPQGLAAMVESPTTGPDAPRFEVASIRRNAGPSIARGGRGGGMTLATGQVRTTNSPLRQLISMAYGLRPTDLLLGGPDWIDTDGFDVDAKPEKQVTVSQARLMLRTLLAERFKLLVRRETREMPVYALTIARADGRLGPQIARPAGECVMVIPFGQAAAGGEVKPPAAGALGPQPTLGTPGRRCGVGPDAGAMRAGSVTMTTLIMLLTPSLDRPVVDKTGLTGTFDFDLRYAGARMVVGPGAGAAGVSPETAADPADGAPSIFTALQEQLGLKLEATRGPVDVLVVHQAEPPTEN